ncbi:MAG: AAA family ATPase [Propionibacteriaceae bacterium]|nr:AAA family ATPase [Propionibacteriaceae bacterium]
MLVGRGPERAALLGLLARARAGEGAALVLRGDPGIGKTALLNDLVESRGDVLVLRTRGVESESPLAFAALHRLLLPLSSRVAELPSPQARALARAFGSGDGEGPDERFLVFLAALTLLTEAAQEHPLLCVIDDAHWLDDASLAALLFIARRVEFSSVALLFAVRDGESRTVDAPDLPRLTLRGLDAAAAEELLQDSDPDLTPPVRAQLIQRTQGNPLALLEIPKALSMPQLTGRSGLPEHLPLSADLERGFAARAGLLSVDAQSYLLLAALDESGDAGVLGSASRRLGLADDAPDAVARSGLVEFGQHEVHFRHPLVRSAVYVAAPPGERRRVHKALAGAFEDHHDPDRAVWHAASAADVPDESTASRLEEAGRRFQQRGGHEAAAAAFERAAQLSTAPAAVGPRLSQAAVASWLAGNPERTRALAQRALAAVSDPGAVADLDRLRAFVELNFGSPRLAHGILAEAARRAGDAGDLQRARQYSMIATVLATFEADSGVPVAVKRLANLDAADQVELCFSTLLTGLDDFTHGRVAEGAPLLRRALDVAEETEAPDLLTNIGIAALLLGDDELALRWHDRQLDAARRQASVLGVVHALTRRAVAQLAMGRWSDLTAATAEVLDLARATGHDNQRALPLAQLLVVDALRGADDVPVRADEVEQLLRHHPSGVLEVLILDTLRWARGIQAARTTPAAAMVQFDAIKLPMIQLAASVDVFEVAQRAEDAAAGERVALELRRFAEATGNRWAHAYAAHAAALVAPEDQRGALFEEALGHHRSAARPFARGRAELAYGEFLRRNRRRVDAREHLRAALAHFEGVGAIGWTTRATNELRASGETARSRTDTHSPIGLTVQELQVAHLVQDGLSNKDVAARLFLSPRTVEFHLRNIFAKLGITSRAALAREELPAAGR